VVLPYHRPNPGVPGGPHSPAMGQTHGVPAGDWAAASAALCWWLVALIIWPTKPTANSKNNTVHPACSSVRRMCRQPFLSQSFLVEAAYFPTTTQRTKTTRKLVRCRHAA